MERTEARNTSGNRGDLLTKKSFLHRYMLLLHSEKDSYLDSTTFYDKTEAAASTRTQTFSYLLLLGLNSLGLKNQNKPTISTLWPPEIRSFTKLHINIPLFILSILKKQQMVRVPFPQGLSLLPLKKEGTIWQRREALSCTERATAHLQYDMQISIAITA